jgi:hypothetical protein
VWRLKRFGLIVGIAAVGLGFATPLTARANTIGPDYVTSDNVTFCQKDAAGG